MRGSVLVSFALLVGTCQAGLAQDVVSASAGVLQYFEGTVLLDGKPVEHKAAVFPSLKNGSVLHTNKGRVELLLTSGVYLRVDENSSLKMLSNSLTDARLEITEGSAILDNLNATPSRAVALVYQGSSVHFPKPGIYRIDCDLGELQVYSGEAEVSHEKASSTIDPSRLYYFSLELSTSKLGDGAMDEFYDWAHTRSDVVADENQRASAEQDGDPDVDPSANGGAFVLPPSFSPPSYSLPSTSIYGTYGSSLYGSINNPFYINPPTPFLGFLGTPTVIVVSPFRHRPVGSRWPVVTTGLGYRPGTVVSRWPVTGQSGSYTFIPGRYGTGSTLRMPVGSGYRPAGAINTRPGYIPTPRYAAPASVPHVAAPHVMSAPHVGAIGHR